MRTDFCRRTCVAGIAAVLWLASACGAPAVEIDLLPQCACRGFVMLGDIAVIRDADKRREAQLAAVPLVPAPAEGQVRWLRVREIQEILELRGIDAADLAFRGSSRVEVSRRSAAGVAVERSPDRSVADAGWQKFAVAAIRPLNRGDVLREVDLELRELAVPRRSEPGQLEAVKEAVGYQVNRPVAAGQNVDMSMLRRPILVQRGGTVAIFARAGGIQVTTRGRALENGALDDIVTVELLDDRTKKLMGRVVSMDEVEVYAQGTRVEPTSRTSQTSPRPTPGK
jgi:flagella basal body P-ring formation protein FlgA